ncbi:hypothetical protein SprV_0602126300 [Sparganum proliferum]
MQARECLDLPCQLSAASNMPPLPTRIMRTNRTRKTPSDAMRQQPDSVNVSSYSRPCGKPLDDDHPRHRQSHCRFPVDINHRDHPPSPNPFIDRSVRQHQKHDITHSPNR